MPYKTTVSRAESCGPSLEETMATQVTERDCPVCGKPVAAATHNRFGEWCCSDAHADEYVAEVRSKKQRELASAGRPRETPREPVVPRSCCG